MPEVPSSRLVPMLIHLFRSRTRHLILPNANSLVCFCLIAVSTACSQYSTAPASRAYHNLTARYNAYLQAREQVQEAEKLLLRNHQENYAQPLSVLIPIDSTSALAVATQLDAALKKASLVAERHQNAKWLDDAYLIIGQIRLLKADFKNAIETFKYINTTSDDGPARQSALIGLLRAYTETEDYTSGLRVAELLRTLPLTKLQTRDYYLTKALLHQRQGQLTVASALVEEALPLMKKGEFKARTLYVQGQLYDQLNKPDQAAARYAAVLSNRPPYDMAFYADLNRLLNGTGKENEFNFARMLEDRKNADLKDQVYYAMATRELGRKNYRQAVEYLRKSAQYAAGKTDQVPFTYLKLAEISYDPLQDYEAASAYYDSTIALLPPSVPDYARIAERQKVLRDFVKQTTIVRTEDSLQRLAQMNPAALDKYLERIVLDKKKREADEIERARQIAAQANQENQMSASTNAAFGTNATAGLWYFYNANAVNVGRQEFQQRWNNRLLEDNWRRSSKENTYTESVNSGTPSGNAVGTGRAVAVVSAGSRNTLKAEKDQLMSQIPFGPQALAASQQRQEEAYFQLGKLYQLNLREPQNAIRTFTTLLDKFPQTPHEPEALYLLHLLHENNTPEVGAKQTDFKQKLITKYPDSYFARLLARGQEGPITAGAQSEAQQLYASAYTQYGQGLHAEALAQTERGLRDYPGNALEDKFALLRVMLLGKLQGPGPYQEALTQFMQNYPASPLLTLAREMLTTATQNAPIKGN
ncbi:MAG: tetratricopeptide repeat protein [Cytophagaceae bacterium]|nr:tetratricopeptide repeat protein [Cytophagaceae bacterium]